MKYLNFFNLGLYQSKIVSLELKLRYVVKTLSLKLKIVLLFFALLFGASLLLLLYHLDKNMSVVVPASGGTLTEGIIGTPRFVNPILAVSDADRDVTMLVYSGLMRIGENGRLIPDLAEKYEISNDGLCYTFILKPKLLWPDNLPITADDVIFTVDQIKNPQSQARNPRRASWEGVQTEKIDDRTIKFCLPKVYTPFLENTTMGILPKHIWQDVLTDPQILLSDLDTNTKPMGSGPYQISKIARKSSGLITSYTLVPNENFAFQKPHITTLVLKFYPSEKNLLEAYKNGEIDSLSAVSPKSIVAVKKEDSYLKSFYLPRVFAVFLNQVNVPLFAEKETRQALSLSADKERIIKEVLENFGNTLSGPIPPASLGAAPEATSSAPFEERLKNASGLLTKAGWSLNSEGVLEKKKNKTETVKMEFSLATSNIPELLHAANILKENWEKLGVRVQIKTYDINDLEQNVIRPRKYDALLFGEIMGRDPDPFAFWHSSQRNDPGLNIAMYVNPKVDKILEETRTILDPDKKTEKYQEFQKELEKDNAAIFLYSPNFIYLLPSSVSGVKETSITIPSERFAGIYNWYIKTKRIWTAPMW